MRCEVGEREPACGRRRRLHDSTKAPPPPKKHIVPSPHPRTHPPGWAIEGAIGSEHKIDASYLSPHVNMASRLEAATKQYGASILLSDDFVRMLSTGVRCVRSSAPPPPASQPAMGDSREACERGGSARSRAAPGLPPFPAPHATPRLS